MPDIEGILNGTELMKIQDDPDNYLIEGLLWEHNQIMLLAKEKVGKSILGIQMACALSCGEALFGEYEIPEPMKVLYIQTESTRHETIQRLRAMTHETGVSWNPENFYLLTTHSLALDSETGMKMLLGEIYKREIEPNVIFIDPLYMSMEGALTEDLASRTMSRNLRKLGEIFSSAIVVVHHEHRSRSNKDGKEIDEGDNSVMGSFVWKAFPNHIIHMRLRPDGMRSLSCTTQRNSKVIRDMRLELTQPLPLMFKIHGTSDHPSYVDTVINWIRKQGDKCAQEVADETGLSISAVKKSLSYLSKHNVNRLEKVNPGKRPTYYRAVQTTLSTAK